jgi:membrane protein
MILKLVLSTYETASDRAIGLTAAGVAFYGMLALFPGLAAVIAIWGLVADPHVLLDQLEILRGILPADVFSLVETQITTLANAHTGQLGWAGLLSTLLAIWSARSGVAAMILALNRLHGRRNRSSLRHYLMAFGLTLALVIGAIVTLSAIVIAPIVLAFVPLGPAAALGIEVIRWLAAIFVLMAGLSLLYRFGPNPAQTTRARWVTPGAILAVFLWGLASYGFSLYLTNFGNYNEVYGSIGAAIALLTWLYISAYLILLGAVLNLELAQLRHRPDTLA